MKKLFALFTPPSAHALAQQQLDNHMRMLLDAEQKQDAARAEVQYHNDCIGRLQRFLHNGGPEVV